MTGGATAELLEGGCHCGAVRFRVAVRSRRGIECNCSVCTKKGYLHLIVPEDQFELLRGSGAIATYTFGTHTAKHHFCRNCGIHSFYRPRSHPDSIDVNIRCLDGIAPSDFQLDGFDGQNWERSVDRLLSGERDAQ